MTEAAILEGNILIAKYMNWTIDNSFPDKGRVYRNPTGGLELDTTFKFHQDWNQLIPVVKKSLTSYFDKRDKMYQALEECDLDKLYQALIEFLIFWFDASKYKMTWEEQPL